MDGVDDRHDSFDSLPYNVQQIMRETVGRFRSSHRAADPPTIANAAQPGDGGRAQLRVVLRDTFVVDGCSWCRCRVSYRSYQPSRKARPMVQSRRLNISQAGVAPLSISILSVSRARTAKM